MRPTRGIQGLAEPPVHCRLGRMAVADLRAAEPEDADLQPHVPERPSPHGAPVMRPALVAQPRRS
jgi:hypothetical protein